MFFDRTSWKFNLNFNDTSELKFKNKKISLNVVAKVCLNPHFKKNFVFDDFSIQHNASPYIDELFGWYILFIELF